MASHWRKAKAALGLNLCVYLPKTLQDDDDEDEENDEDSSGNRMRRPSVSRSSSLPSRSIHSSPNTPKRSSSFALKLTNTGTRSSKKICAICLGNMRPGQGHAIFTAECSHAFHFNCIASNVKHGNQVCPVCRARWKEVPFQRPTDLSHGKTRINPLGLAQDDSWMRLPHQGSRSNVNRQIASIPTTSEPGEFDDDEPLEHESNGTVSKSPSTDRSSTKAMYIKIEPEVSSVERHISRENFSVLIHLKAPVMRACCDMKLMPTTSSRAPVDLVTVLDISGSMAGTKLALLKRAMGFVIQNLGLSDRLSVIAFSSTARRLFSLRRMTDVGKQQALQAVNSLVSNGGTNIAEGLKKAAKVMEERRVKNPVGSIILLSDGQDTYNNQNKRSCDYKSLVPLSSVKGIPVHAFGFGADHDAASMHSIAEASGGTFSFIEAEGVMQDAFAQCIGGILSVVVQDLRVGINCVHPDIRLGPLKTGSYATEVLDDARSAFIHVGDLYADEARDFLVSVNVPPAADDETITTTTTMLLRVNGVYRDPVSKETMTLDSKEVWIHRPDFVRGEQVVSIEVDRQRNRVEAAASMAEARVAAEGGDLSSAVLILDKFRSLLSETASARAEDGLCVALDAEVKEMQERMTSRRMYEHSGRAYVLSGLSSHSWQRATARGDSTDISSSLLRAYQTPSMVDMVTRSQAQGLAGGPSSHPSVRPRPHPR
ncbi:hypothetical protein ACHQM5_020571 [Ranunculus cassubicifolius]